MPIIDVYLLPGSLWLIMLSMGLSLQIKDIRRVFVNRRALFVGAISMLIVPPIVGISLALFFAPSAALAVGLVLLATCPGGMLSNLMTDIAKGDLALSLSLSILVSAIYVFLVPFYAHFALGHFLGVEQKIQIPLGQFFWKIFSITLLPTTIGVLFRAWKNDWAIRIKSFIKVASTIVLVIAFSFILVDQIPTLKLYFADLLWILLALNGITVLIAWLVTMSQSMSTEERVAIGIEHIIRQEGTAIFIAVTLVGNREISLPMIVNTPVALVLGILFVVFARNSLKKKNSIQSSSTG